MIGNASKDENNPKNKKYCVYVHTVPRDVSGYRHDKKYVGITCKKYPEQRWEHGYGYRWSFSEETA